MSKLETIVCPKNSKFYYVKSSDELAAERAADAKVGRFLNDAGESILILTLLHLPFWKIRQ